MKTFLPALWFAILLLTVSCKEDPAESIGNGTLQIEFENVVGPAKLTLGNQTYQNALGESYTVSQLMYYVSNFTLQKSDGSTYTVPESYFLIDQQKDESRTITLKDIPVGDYTGVSFLIGVDSTRNTSGVQSGALDPMHGMFWTWNTGYIFVRLEGNSPQSTHPDNRLQYHIGGFKGASNCIRVASPSLNGSVIPVRFGKTPQAHYRVDFSKLFDGPTRVSFATLSAVHGGPDAVKLADNYQLMFTLDHVHSQD